MIFTLKDTSMKKVVVRKVSFKKTEAVPGQYFAELKEDQTFKVFYHTNGYMKRVHGKLTYTVTSIISEELKNRNEIF
jgi:hypothetical protein